MWIVSIHVGRHFFLKVRKEPLDGSYQIHIKFLIGNTYNKIENFYKNQRKKLEPRWAPLKKY